MNMPLIALGFGILLNFLGLGSFVTTGMVSATALIPCVPGVLIGICGLIAQKESRLKHAMHAAAIFGLLGFLAPLGRLMPLFVKGEFELTPATGSMIMMLVICGIFVGLCVKSFIDVRKAKKAATESASSE
jgi:hypothetical protein